LEYQKKLTSVNGAWLPPEGGSGAQGHNMAALRTAGPVREFHWNPAGVSVLRQIILGYTNYIQKMYAELAYDKRGSC
jgi:hypothetical protein